MTAVAAGPSPPWQRARIVMGSHAVKPDAAPPSPAPPPFPLKRKLLRLGLWMALAGGILFGVLVWWCAAEIAEPPRRPVRAASQAYFDGTAGAGFRVEKFVTSDGMPCLVCTPEHAATFSKRAGILRGQLAEKGIATGPSGKTVGTLMILHGRAGMKEDYLAVAERFCAVGFRCVIPDLPGHGANERRYTTYGVLEAPMILKCHEEAAAKFGFSGEPCMLLGQSMGGAVAVHAAALDGSPFAALVVVSSFDRLDTVVRGQTRAMLGGALGELANGSADHVFGWKTGVRISEIDSARKAREVLIPTLVIHGEADRTIPLAAGKKLHDSFPGDGGKRWLVVPEAGHNNILVTDYPLYAAMAEWFLAHLGPRAGG